MVAVVVVVVAVVGLVIVAVCCGSGISRGSGVGGSARGGRGTVVYCSNCNGSRSCVAGSE